MAQDVLGPDRVIEKINASADTLSSPLQAIAAFAHACMLSIGFRFIGFGEDHHAGTSHGCINEDVEFDESNVQKLWTSESDSHTEFRYAHPQSSMQYVIKVSRMGIKTLVLGMAIGVDRTVSLDIVTQDFTSAAFFPWRSGDRDIVQGFIGEHRVRELASLIKINVLQRLINNLNKEGYQEEGPTSSTSTSAQQYLFPRDKLT
jgi:proteasome inhibitor subunit 1 (PI31)